MRIQATPCRVAIFEGQAQPIADDDFASMLLSLLPGDGGSAPGGRGGWFPFTLDSKV